MGKTGLCLVAILAGAALAGRASADTYRNPRFGYSVRYPDGSLTPGRESDNGDGLAFTAPGSKADIRVFAGYTAATGQDAASTARDALALCGGRKPTLHLVRTDLVAVSCAHAGTITYQKTLLGHGRATTLLATYPTAERGRLDPVVRALAGSLRPATR